MAKQERDNSRFLSSTSVTNLETWRTKRGPLRASCPVCSWQWLASRLHSVITRARNTFLQKHIHKASGSWLACESLWGVSPWLEKRKVKGKEKQKKKTVYCWWAPEKSCVLSPRFKKAVFLNIKAYVYSHKYYSARVVILVSSLTLC